jgi:putative transposase
LIEQYACEDKGYDFPFCRRRLQRKLYVVHIPKRGATSVNVPRSKGTPSRWWVVERTQRWTNLFRELKIRYARKTVNYEAMVHFANAIICFLMA